eukprot:388090_1
MANEIVVHESLKELYSYVKNDQGFDLLKQTLNAWEYDLDLLKDDIQEEEGELQDIIPESLYTKIKAIINGEYVAPIVQLIKEDQDEKKISINDIYDINDQPKQISAQISIPKNTTYDSQ